LRESIVEPAKSLPEGFLQYKAETQSGATISGMRLHEDPFDLLLKDGAGKLHSLRKANLRSLTALPNTSPMPGYQRLSASDLRDLVAYLASLKGDTAK
jgi:putative heme-binding domain-containing protein